LSGWYRAARDRFRSVLEDCTLRDKPTRVDLDRMQKAYDSTRANTMKVPVLTQRAVAHIDRDLHMIGRVGI
jgi:hypothetical protein